MTTAFAAPHVRSRFAFTLIELLVVIAVIALLIAILLPALGRARVAGRQTVVLTRLHDMGVGTAAYMQDFKDKMPALRDYDEKPILSLSVLARDSAIPYQAFLNPNTQDSLATRETIDGRPILADLAGAEIDAGSVLDLGNIGQVNWHCSFSFDNDVKPHAVWKPVVYMGDRADYVGGKTMSQNWKGEGMCLVWTDQHAAFSKTRAMKDQSDPNIYHHNEFGGEGASEVREGVAVTKGTLDTHMRYFSEDEDDVLLPDNP